MQRPWGGNECGKDNRRTPGWSVMRREHGEGDEAAARPHRALWSAGLGLLKVPWAALKCFNGRGSLDVICSLQ